MLNMQIKELTVSTKNRNKRIASKPERLKQRKSFEISINPTRLVKKKNTQSKSMTKRKNILRR